MTGGGRLQVENASTETTGRAGAILRLGQNTEAAGEAEIVGEGSRIDVVQRGSAEALEVGAEVQIGGAGQGILRVNGGTLNVLGDDPGIFLGVGRFDLPVTPRQSLLEITNGGEVLVDSQSYGGSPNSGESFYRGSAVSIASQSASSARIVIDGQGSRLTVTGDSSQAGDYGTGTVFAGYRGSGFLDLSDGARLEAGNLRIGAATTGMDSNGSYRFEGFGFLENVDAAASGAVSITGGATVDIETPDSTPYRGVQLGLSSGTSGVLNIEGAELRSSLISQGGAGQIRVGFWGSGELSISDGAEARGFFGEAGRNAGSEGVINVTGSGSRLFLSDAYGRFTDYAEGGFLRVGREADAYGRLSVTDGGRVDIANDPAGNLDLPALQIARNTGSAGMLEIDGAASRVNIALSGPSDDALDPGRTYGAYAVIGRGGDGQATVSNGGTLTVSGADSRLFIGGNNPELFDDVGTSGSGELIITSGGSVSVTGLDGVTSISSQSTNTGIVRAEGTGSALNAGTLLLVGEGWDEETDSVTGTGGSAFLDIAGGSVSAGRTIVGAGSAMDGDGALEGDLEVKGELSLKPGAQGRLALTGDLSVMPDAALEFGVAEFDTDTGGTVAVEGDADFGLARAFIDLRVADPTVAAGDSFTLATVAGSLAPGQRYFAQDGSAFRLGPEGGDLVLSVVDLSGAEALSGGPGEDGLIGLEGDDTLSGGGGDDILSGGAGSDSLEGGQGIDRAVYSASPAPVDVALAAPSRYSRAAMPRATG